MMAVSNGRSDEALQSVALEDEDAFAFPSAPKEPLAVRRRFELSGRSSQVPWWFVLMGESIVF
jgi:hypothetical protein